MTTAIANIRYTCYSNYLIGVRVSTEVRYCIHQSLSNRYAQSLV